MCCLVVILIRNDIMFGRAPRTACALDYVCARSVVRACTLVVACVFVYARSVCRCLVFVVVCLAIVRGCGHGYWRGHGLPWSFAWP